MKKKWRKQKSFAKINDMQTANYTQLNQSS